MSYYTFIACSRELRCGEYRTPPKAIYPSYTDYKDSEDYRFHEALDPREYRYSVIDKRPFAPEKAFGSVYVYDLSRKEKCLRIDPFPGEAERLGAADFISSLFTLPYIYEVSGYNLSLRDFICASLSRKDRLEALTLFLGHGELPSKPVKHAVDLQVYADGNQAETEISRSCRRPPDSMFTEYIPPCAPLPDPDFAYFDPSDRVCIIHGSMRGEDWDTKKLRQQKIPLRQHDFFIQSALKRRQKLQQPESTTGIYP